MHAENLEEAVKLLQQVNAKRILIQFPEGIKRKIQAIAKEIENRGLETVLCLDATYGACDVREHEAKLLKCDAILHVGHGDFGVKTKLPVVYMSYFLNGNPIPILKKEFHKLENFEKIGLLTSIQFVPAMRTAKKFLEERGKKIFTYRTQTYEAQILGCRLTAGKEVEDKVDAFLCISAGKFYGLGMVLETEKPMLSLDLEKGEIEDLNAFKKKIQKITAWNVATLKEAKRVGLLVSWKRGQMFGSPFLIKKKLEQAGKEVFVLAMDEITPEKLEGLKLDIVLNFACPRIGTDDLEKYKIPIVNYYLALK